MTETEFRKLLNKLDGYFLPRKIGSTAREWITAGSLLGETSIVDIKRILSKEPINCHFSELGDEIRIHVSSHDSVILRIPKISNTPRIRLLPASSMLFLSSFPTCSSPFPISGKVRIYSNT